MRVFRRSLTSLVVAIGLGLAGTLHASAQREVPPKPVEPRHGVAGEITAVSIGAIVVTDRSGEAVTVKVTPATKIFQPTAVALADVKAGEPVQIYAEHSRAGALIATIIDVNPTSMSGRGETAQHPGTTEIQGTIVQVGSGALTVNSSDGSSVSVQIVDETRIGTLAPVSADHLTVGARVAVEGTTGADGTVTAALILVAEARKR
jgi:hypothetical protein